MKLNRRNMVLLATLVVVAAVDLGARSSVQRPSAGEPVFARYERGRAATIRVERGGETLTLGLEGKRWVVRDRANFAALASAVDELLSRLALVTTGDAVAAESSSHALYGLGDDAAHLVVLDDSAAVVVDAWIGRPRDEAVGSYLRIANAPTVYRAAGISPVSASASSWLDTRMLDVDLLSVRALQGELADGRSFRIVKREDGLWIDGTGRSVRPAVVNPLLLRANTMYFEDIVSVTREAAGLETPWASLRFELDEGGDRTLSVGGPVGTVDAASGRGTRAAARGEWSQPWVAAIPASAATQFEEALARIAGALR